MWLNALRAPLREAAAARWWSCPVPDVASMVAFALRLSIPKEEKREPLGTDLRQASAIELHDDRAIAVAPPVLGLQAGFFALAGLDVPRAFHAYRDRILSRNSSTDARYRIPRLELSWVVDIREHNHQSLRPFRDKRCGGNAKALVEAKACHDAIVN